MLRSGRKGGGAVAAPDGSEVRGGIVEASAKMCASLNSDRLFGVVNNETKISGLASLSTSEVSRKTCGTGT